jgi:pilus assembly protein CpaB
MRLARLILLVVLVLVLGVAAIFVVLSLNGGGGDDPPTSNVPVGNVVMLAQPVGRGTVLEINMLILAEIPQANILDTMFTEIEEVAGRVARFDMGPSTILTESMVVEGGVTDTAGSDHALLIPQGMVAYAIPISRLSSLAYGLQRGDHVNVIASVLIVDLDAQFQTLTPNHSSSVIPPGQNVVITVETVDYEEKSISASPLGGTDTLNNIVAQIISTGSLGRLGRAELDPVLNQPFYVVPSEPLQRPRLVSQTVLNNVVVLNVGTFPFGAELEPVIQPTPNPDGTTTGAVEDQTPQTNTPPDILTLIVSPQDAVALNYLVYTGAELTLALRASGDDAIIETQAVTLQFLLDNYRIPVPSRQAYGITPATDVLQPPTLENDIPDPNNNQ